MVISFDRIDKEKHTAIVKSVPEWYGASIDANQVRFFWKIWMKKESKRKSREYERYWNSSLTFWFRAICQFVNVGFWIMRSLVYFFISLFFCTNAIVQWPIRNGSNIKCNNGIKWKTIIEIYSKETTQNTMLFRCFRCDWNEIQRTCEHIRVQLVCDESMNEIGERKLMLKYSKRFTKTGKRIWRKTVGDQRLQRKNKVKERK